MRTTLTTLTILLTICIYTSYAQTPTILKHKCSRVFTHYGHNSIAATDSIIRMLPADIWFRTLDIKDQHFRINRIRYYETITKKRPKNNVYLKGWVYRALN